MSSSGFAAQDGRTWPSPEPAASPTPTAPLADPGLMEHVLRETLAASDVDGAVDVAEREALRTVAERHAGVLLSLEPVTQELVHALLNARFRCVVCPPDVWQNLARQIAQTLWEDPTCRARLQSLWTRLTEAAG